MATRTITPAEWLDLLIDRAPALRQAGVRRVDLKGVVVDLAPVDAPEARPDSRDDSQGYLDPLEDPALYPGGRVPSFGERQ